jgi:secreted trypsin-like serine protease
VTRRAGWLPARLGTATLLLAAAIALPAAPAGAIANGREVPTGAYPFSVKLTMTGILRADGSRGAGACSAALIAPSWVITARHCFHDPNRAPVSGPVPYPTTATLGRTDVNDPGGAVLPVVSVVASPSKDIALARLARPVTGVPMLPLAVTGPGQGEILIMTGWGATSGTNPAPVDRLRSGEFQVSAIAAATIGVTGHRPAADTSACLSDSGAPYFRTAGTGVELVAVESRGATCPHTSPETASRVDTEIGWIADTITAAGGSGAVGIRPLSPLLPPGA